MIIVISLFFALIVLAIVMKIAYGYVIKESGRDSTGVAGFIIMVLFPSFFAFMFAWLLPISIAQSMYESNLVPDDFPYRHEIPIKDVIVTGSEESPTGITYIALDGTSHSSSDAFVECSPDDDIHLISLYKTDIWIGFHFCLYQLTVQVPERDWHDGMTADEVEKYVQKARLELVENKIELPTIADEGEQAWR